MLRAIYERAGYSFNCCGPSIRAVVDRLIHAVDVMRFLRFEHPEWLSKCPDCGDAKCFEHSQWRSWAHEYGIQRDAVKPTPKYV